MATPETRLVKKIVDAVRKEWPAAFVQKNHGSIYMPAGTPDLLVIIDGRASWFEIKAPRPGETIEAALRRVTPIQRVMLSRLRKAGCLAEAATSVESVIAYLSHLH